MELRKEDVIDFWDHMSKKYKFDVIQKDTSVAMHAAGFALDAIGVTNKEKFMEDFAVTLANNVYVPFHVGDGKESELLGQVMVAVHESQHVLQWRRNPLKFMRNYLFNDAARAHYEAEAYRTNMEIYHFFTGKMLSPTKLANLLKNYGVDAGDIRVTRKNLESSRRVIENGYVISGVSKHAIKWWKK